MKDRIYFFNRWAGSVAFLMGTLGILPGGASAVDSYYVGKLDEIIEINAVSGHQTHVTGPETELRGPWAWDYDATGNRVYASSTPSGDGTYPIGIFQYTDGQFLSVANPPTDFAAESMAIAASGLVYGVHPSVASQTVQEWDSASNMVRVVTGGSTGSGPSVMPRIVVAESASSLLIAGEGVPSLTPGIYRVDIATGVRTLLSSSVVGSGPEFFAFDIDVDASGDLICVSSLGELWLVNLSTGNRTQVAATDFGSSVTYRAKSLALNSAKTTAYVIAETGTPAQEVILSVDMATLNSAIVSSSTVGTGPRMTGLGQLRYEAGGTLLTSAPWMRFMRIDPATGNRSIVAQAPSKGTGPVFNAADLAQGDNQSLYVLDDLAWQVLQVDCATGNRTVISNWETGAGPAFDNPTCITHGNDVLAGDRLYVWNAGNISLYGVNLLTGDRTVYASPLVGTGTVVYRTANLAYKDYTVYLLESGYGEIFPTPSFVQGRIVSLHVMTGSRSIVPSSAVNGSGYGFDISGNELAYSTGPISFMSGFAGATELRSLNTTTSENVLTYAPGFLNTPAAVLINGANEVVISDPGLLKMSTYKKDKQLELEIASCNWLSNTSVVRPSHIIKMPSELTASACEAPVPIGDSDPIDIPELGVMIDFSSNESAGSVTITPFHVFAPNLPGSLPVYWEITGLASGTFLATLAFEFNENMLDEAGLTANELALFRSGDAGANWQRVDATVDGFTITTDSPQSQFSLWALGDASSRVPGWREFQQ